MTFPFESDGHVKGFQENIGLVQDLEDGFRPDFVPAGLTYRNRGLQKDIPDNIFVQQDDIINTGGGRDVWLCIWGQAQDGNVNPTEQWDPLL